MTELIQLKVELWKNSNTYVKTNFFSLVFVTYKTLKSIYISDSFNLYFDLLICFRKTQQKSIFSTFIWFICCFVHILLQLLQLWLKWTQVSVICLACRKKLPSFFTQNCCNLISVHVRIEKIPFSEYLLC